MVSIWWGFSNLFQPQISLLSSILDILTWISINISNIYKAKRPDCISTSLSTINLLILYLPSSLKIETPFFQVFRPKTFVSFLTLLFLLHPAFNLLSNVANLTTSIYAESDWFSSSLLDCAGPNHHYFSYIKPLNWSPCFHSTSYGLFPTWKVEWPFYYCSQTLHPST